MSGARMNSLLSCFSWFMRSGVGVVFIRRSFILFLCAFCYPRTSWNSCGNFFMFINLAGIDCCPESIALLARWFPSRTYLKLLLSSITMMIGYVVSAWLSLCVSIPPVFFLIIMFSIFWMGILYTG